MEHLPIVSLSPVILSYLVDPHTHQFILESPDIKRVDLSNRSLFRQSVAEINTLFRAITGSSVTLDLSDNDLGRKNTSELVCLLSSIPFSVTFLNLALNHLERKTHAELCAIFNAIPRYVTSLRLSGEDINLRRKEDLSCLGSALPYIKSIEVDGVDASKLAAFQTFMGRAHSSGLNLTFFDQSEKRGCLDEEKCLRLA